MDITICLEDSTSGTVIVRKNIDEIIEKHKNKIIEEFIEKLLNKAVDDSFLVEIDGITADCMIVDYFYDLVDIVKQEMFDKV